MLKLFRNFFKSRYFDFDNDNDSTSIGDLFEFEFNFAECALAANDTSIDIDLPVQILKLTGFLLHILFFIFVAKFKEFHSRNSAYLVNLALVSFLFLLNGLVAFQPNFICDLQLFGFCAYQALFVQYYSYLYSYSVVSLACYRLVSVYRRNINKYIKMWKICASIGLTWLIPLVMLIMPIYVSHYPVSYKDALNSCRFEYKQRSGGFRYFLLFSFILPTLLIGVIYIFIALKVMRVKNKVATQCKIECKLGPDMICPRPDDAELYTITGNVQQANTGDSEQQSPSCELASRKTGSSQKFCIKRIYKIRKRRYSHVHVQLIFQFMVIFVIYMLYSCSNIILTIQLTVKESTFDMNLIKIVRLFIWINHFLNPILFLTFHPVFKIKLKKLFKFIESFNSNR